MEEPQCLHTKLRDLGGKRLLVLGGLGFLGRSIVAMAAKCNADVVVMDKSSLDIKDSTACIIHDDILSSKKLDSLIEHADYIIHLAGSLGTESTFSDLPSTILNNVVSTARVIESCLKARRRAVYPMVGNDWLNPYTISRRCAADLGIMANLECGGDFRILRVMNAYGPWQAFSSTHKIVPVFMRQCLLNEQIEIYGTGYQCIDLIYTQDVAVAFLLACVEDHLPGNAYIEVGTGIPYRVLEVAELIRELTRSQSEIQLVKHRRMGEPLRSVTLARDNALEVSAGFEPQVLLKQGLQSTLEWYIKHPEYLGLRRSSSDGKFNSI